MSTDDNNDDDNKLDEILEEIAALRQDVRSILAQLPTQQIPADPDSEVQ